MSAEIFGNSGVEGGAEAIYANNPAWHRLGTTFKPGEGIGMLTADVERICPTIFAERSLLPIGGFTRPVDLTDPTALITPSEILDGADWRMIARTDGANARVHGVAKKGYRIWQVREAFAFLDNLVSDGQLQYESTFALKGGDHVVLVCRLPGAFKVGESDVSFTYIMVRVSFTGNDSIVMVPTCVRVVCANTVALALSSGKGAKADSGKPLIFRLRHTASLDSRLTEAREHLASVDDLLTAKAERAGQLAETHVSESAAKSFISAMFAERTDDGEPLSKRQDTERERKVTVLRESWVAERSTMERSLIGSAWHMLNAVTRAVDHGGLERRKGSDRARDENTFLSITEGTGAVLKAKAETLLLQLA